jgi:hypothetical protein
MGTMSVMNGDVRAEVTALAINVTIPEELRWTDTRRGETFTLTTLNVRLLADGHLAVKARRGKRSLSRSVPARSPPLSGRPVT